MIKAKLRQERRKKNKIMNLPQCLHTTGALLPASGKHLHIIIPNIAATALDLPYALLRVFQAAHSLNCTMLICKHLGQDISLHRH